MALDDVYVLTISATTGGGIAQNSLAFRRTTAAEPTTADFQTLAGLVKDLHVFLQNASVIYQSWRARQVRGANVTYPTGADCSPVGGNLFEGGLPGTLVGAETSEMLPHQCALVVTLRTATIGRRARGRFYAFGFSENNQVGGQWNSAIRTTMTSNWTGFVGNHDDADPTDHFRLGIWSVRTATGCGEHPTERRHTRLDPPNPAEAFTPVTLPVIRPTVYTQRRRVAGVGL